MNVTAELEELEDLLEAWRGLSERIMELERRTAPPSVDVLVTYLQYGKECFDTYSTLDEAARFFMAGTDDEHVELTGIFVGGARIEWSCIKGLLQS